MIYQNDKVYEGILKNVLFVCKHNVFRSRVAEECLNGYGTTKYRAESAGLISLDEETLSKEKVHPLQKEVARRYGLDLSPKSRSLSHSILKRMDIVIIVADDVSPEIIQEEKSFNVKVILWKIKDVEEDSLDLEQCIVSTIKQICEKVEEFVND